MGRPKKYGTLCSACDEDFAGITAFDAHRVGRHEYTFKEGLDMEPSRYNGRRCLDRDEMQKKGFTKNSYNRWSAPEAKNA